MRTSFKLLAVGSFAALAALGAVNASAETMDGSDFHPLQMNSPERPDVQAGAMAAARPTGTEPVGQSTSAPAMNSTLPVSDIQAGAYAASHPTGTEPIGQSTSLPMVKSGTGS
ncbi:hypothetical protein QTI51_34295 [Variovorax sp. J22G73]|jgi:hypothetical protein|uniref:hypothetical protein n=1 Tax=unclassified Variovorax TaxID=663243 RepID=UPI000D5C5601|nr:MULTISPECIES: hypothetical protein [unclassified Variovorax]MDM0009882.1 hypothetical protein [Variovorax sp. J22R203]MDM0102390.1 hypothetical protein [Variovorax sp. J22G73]